MRAVETLYFDKKFQLSECRYYLVILELSPQGKSCFPLGTAAFAKNVLIRYFNELEYFSSVTSISWQTWNRTRLYKIHFPPNLRGTDFYSAWAIELEVLDFPETLTQLSQFRFNNLHSGVIFILRSDISSTSTPLYPSKAAVFYVADELVDTYKANWSSYFNASQFHPLSEFTE